MNIGHLVDMAHGQPQFFHGDAEHKVALGSIADTAAAGPVMNRRRLIGSAAAAMLLPTAFAASGADKHLPAFQAALRLGPAQDGSGNHRWADIVGGSLSGKLVNGRVQSGRMDWFVDPASGAVEVAITCDVLRSDGTTIRLRDRTARAAADAGAAIPGHPTAPELCEASGRAIRAPFVGRLDATAIWRGFVTLRAFATV
jgi:hypothetical protein